MDKTITYPIVDQDPRAACTAEATLAPGITLQEFGGRHQWVAFLAERCTACGRLRIPDTDDPPSLAPHTHVTAAEAPPEATEA